MRIVGRKIRGSKAMEGYEEARQDACAGYGGRLGASGQVQSEI